MARNRKRAKERRARRPQGAAVRPRLATAADNGAPDPIEHAAPDVDLANAQLAMGRPDPLEPTEDPQDEAEFEAEAEEEAEEFEEAEAGFEEAQATGGGQPPRGQAVAPAAGAVPERAAGPRSRLVAFLQGSWRELQRVQWPDRRQVVQATGVVLGFVIIAGLYLALADTLATKLMNFILK